MDRLTNLQKRGNSERRGRHSAGSPRRAAKVGQQTAACGFLFFARLYHTSVKWGGGRNKAVLKNETVFYMSCLFKKNKLSHIYWAENNIPLFNPSPTLF